MVSKINKFQNTILVLMFLSYDLAGEVPLI